MISSQTFARCSRRAGRALILLAAVVSGLGIQTTPAAADSARSISVTAHFTDPGVLVPTATKCDIVNGVVGVPVRGSARFGMEPDDNWTGGVSYNICMYVMADRSERFYGTETFTGDIRSCGVGTISYNVSDGMVNPAPLGSITQHGTETWKIIPRSGTGRLSTVSAGSGSGVFTMSSTVVGGGSGVYTGTFTCKV